MSKSVVNIIDFPVLYNILSELKDFLHFEIMNYENENAFLEEIQKESSIKNYTIITKNLLLQKEHYTKLENLLY